MNETKATHGDYSQRTEAFSLLNQNHCFDFVPQLIKMTLKPVKPLPDLQKTCEMNGSTHTVPTNGECEGNCRNCALNALPLSRSSGQNPMNVEKLFMQNL